MSMFHNIPDPGNKKKIHPIDGYILLLYGDNKIANSKDMFHNKYLQCVIKVTV